LKKILDIVSYRYLPSISGGQKSIALFLEYLGAASELYVAGTKNNDNSRIKHYKPLSFLSKNPVSYIDLWGWIKIRKFILRNEIKTVIVEHPYIGWMGVLLKFTLNIQLIFHTHNIEYLRFKSLGKWWWKIMKYYEYFVLKNADKIFCISQEDLDWMTVKMGIQKSKCIVVPYGIVQNTIPLDKEKCKINICKRYDLDYNKPLLLFNGLLSYKPNEEALYNILNEILPRMIEAKFDFNLIIAGKGLNPALNDLESYKGSNVLYAGFVDDIDELFKAADIFLNPVISGGGVKTKLIEALGMNCTCISTEAGAIGVDKYACGNKLKIVTNKDWSSFVTQILDSSKLIENIPDVFYKSYNWRNIIKEILNTEII